MKNPDVIVIGAGAAGLFCAFQAGLRGLSVLVLEGSNKPGKKILMSGGGRCNFTNLHVEPGHFISANPHFCKSALKRYNQWDFLALVEKHGIAWEERSHGQLFCLDSAKDILQMLLHESEQAGVEIKTHCTIEAVEYHEGAGQRYQLQTSLGRFGGHSLVVATGALSIPTMGASDFGYRMARQFGLEVLPQRAGLVPFTFSDELRPVCERLSGLALPVTASTGKTAFTENLLFTHRGLSGPVILQLSNYWHSGEYVYIDLLPDTDLHNWLPEQKTLQPRSLLRTVLSQKLAKSLVLELQAMFWTEYAEKPLAEWPNKALLAVADKLHNWQLKPSGTEGYRTAEVTLGGVSTDELSSKTMECKKQPGLYFIGEVVDVTGHLGGFNFQWAWSSAYSCAEALSAINDA